MNTEAVTQQAIDFIHGAVRFYEREVTKMESESKRARPPFFEWRIFEMSCRMAQLKRDLERIERE